MDSGSNRKCGTRSLLGVRFYLRLQERPSRQVQHGRRHPDTACHRWPTRAVRTREARQLSVPHVSPLETGAPPGRKALTVPAGYEVDDMGRIARISNELSPHHPGACPRSLILYFEPRESSVVPERAADADAGDDCADRNKHRGIACCSRPAMKFIVWRRQPIVSQTVPDYVESRTFGPLRIRRHWGLTATGRSFLSTMARLMTQGPFSTVIW